MFLRFNVLRDLLNEIMFKMSKNRSLFNCFKILTQIFLKILITKTKLMFCVIFLLLYFYNEECLETSDREVDLVLNVKFK